MSKLVFRRAECPLVLDIQEDAHNKRTNLSLIIFKVLCETFMSFGAPIFMKTQYTFVNINVLKYKTQSDTFIDISHVKS